MNKSINTNIRNELDQLRVSEFKYYTKTEK